MPGTVALLTEIETPGRTAPCGSVAVPRRLPLALVCPRRGCAIKRHTQRTLATRHMCDHSFKKWKTGSGEQGARRERGVARVARTPRCVLGRPSLSRRRCGGVLWFRRGWGADAASGFHHGERLDQLGVADHVDVGLIAEEIGERAEMAAVVAHVPPMVGPMGLAFRSVEDLPEVRSERVE